MSDSKSTDHWNVLARLLGTAPADVPEEETEMPEPPAAELVVEEPAIEPACEQEAVVEPEAVAEVVSVFEPAPVEVREPANQTGSETRATPYAVEAQTD